jgi:cysteine desulfurase
MDGKKVSCSTGAACTAGVHRPSHVLMAMGRDDIGATSSLRFSLGANTTEEDIEYTLSVIPEVIEMAKAANSL